MSLQVLIPKGLPVFLCMNCGEGFTRDQEPKWIRHCRDCFKRHPEKFEAAVARREETVFTKPADEELYRWYREGKT